MFQFTTTNVINANKDYTTGLKLWSVQASKDDNKPVSLNVKRHLNFKKPNVVSITKAEYTAPKIAKATLDFSKLAIRSSANYRIAMYIKLAQSSANSYYANDLVFKGKPFYVEFVWKNEEDAATVAKRIKDIVKKYMITVYEKELVKVTNDGTKVVIEGIDEYQRFERVDIEEYITGRMAEMGVPTTTPVSGEYRVIKSALTKAHKEDPEYDENFTIEQGVEGFGTYQWILKNLRLPTAARTSWTAINADEAPIIGAKYNEYIIRYCVNRGIMGGDAVGEVTKSLTTHVFYVNQAVSAEFETALSKIAPAEGILVIPPVRPQLESTTPPGPDGDNTQEAGSV